MQGLQPPLDSNSASATAAAAPGLPPLPGLTLPPPGQLHVPWTLDQFVWDPSALTAAPGGPPPALPLLRPAAGDDEDSGRTANSQSGPASADAAASGLAPTAAAVHADQAGSALAAALAAGQPLPDWPAAAPPPPAPPPGGKPAFCQVCHEGVAGLKDYYARYKICPNHCVMPGIVKDGRVLRFCQQCGRFQPIEDFDYSKRTCRRKLDRHNSRRRNLTKARAAGGGTTSTRSSTAATARKPKPKRALTATPAPDAPPEQQLKREQPEQLPRQQQQQQQPAAGQPLPPDVARALGLPPAGDADPTAAAAAAAAAAGAAADEEQQQVPMDLDELLSGLAVQPQPQQSSPPVAAQLQQPLVLPSPAAGAGGLLGVDVPILASPVLPGLSGSPASAAGGKRLQPPPTVPAGVAAQLQQRQPAAAAVAPGRLVAGPEFDSLIEDLLGSNPPNASNAWLADVLLPSGMAAPGGAARPLQAPPPLPPFQQQQGAQPLQPLSGFPIPSLMPATDSLATTAASGGSMQPGAAVKSEPAFAAPMPTVAMPALPPFPAQELGISGLQAAPLQMQPPPLAAAAPGRLLMPQPFGAAAPQLLLLPQFGAWLPQVGLPPPASLEQALAIMGQQPAGMMPLFHPQAMQPPHVQLSLKLFGVTPEALPTELRWELQSLLGSPMLEGYLRPGCSHLTLDALLQDEQQLAALRSMGVAGAVQHLLHTTTGLGSLLHRAPVLVQLGDELAVVAEGKVQRVLKLSACEGVLPRISSIHPLVLLASSAANSSSNPSSSSSHGEHPGNAGPAAAEPAAAGQQAAGGERILVRGSALLGEQCRLLVRSGGAYPLVEILASSGPLGVPRRAAGTAGTAGTAGVFAREDEWLEIRLPEVREGLYTVEAQRGGLLGCSRALLALADERAVVELRSLEANSAGFTDVDAFLRSIALVLRHQQLQAASAASGSNDSEHAGSTSFSDGSDAAEEADGEMDSHGTTAAAAAPLAQLAAKAARAGVAAAASRGWPGVTALLLPSIAADGRLPADAVCAIDALCPPSSPLLHLATASRSAPLLQVLDAWGRQQGYAWSVAAPAGPSALTPMHLAAAARDGPLAKALFELDPAGARSAWHTAQTSDGLTPAAFAALAKQRLAAAAAGATLAAKAAAQPAEPDGVAAAAAGSAAGEGQPGNGQLPPSSAPLAMPTALPLKQAEPPSPGSPKSPNGVAVSEAELSASSISSGGSFPQLAALATGLSGQLGSGQVLLSPTAVSVVLAPSPSLPAAFADGNGEAAGGNSEAHAFSPPTPEIKPTRLSAEGPVLGATAAERCKALALVPPATAAAMLAVRAGPAEVGRSASVGAESGSEVSGSASSVADEDGTGIGAPSSSDADDTSRPASQGGSPLRMSESPPLLKPGSGGAAAEAAVKTADGDRPSADAALEHVSSGSAKAQLSLSCRWEAAAALPAVPVECNCCGGGDAWVCPAKGLGGGASKAGHPCWVDRVLADHESGCAEVLASARSSLGADGQAEVDALLQDFSRNDAACAMAVAAAGEGALLDLHAAAAAAPKKVVDEEEEDEKEAAEGASDGAAGKCSLGSAAGRARAPWLFGLGTAAAHRLSHIFSSSVRRR